MNFRVIFGKTKQKQSVSLLVYLKNKEKKLSDNLIKTMDDARVLLKTLNARMEELDQHQYIYDLMGLGLTALGLVIAVVAIIFMVSIKDTAKVQAIAAAEAAVGEFLKDPRNTENAIESWLDSNRSEIVEELSLTFQSIQGPSGIGDDYASAWGQEELFDEPITTEGGDEQER